MPEKPLANLHWRGYHPGRTPAGTGAAGGGAAEKFTLAGAIARAT